MRADLDRLMSERNFAAIIVACDDPFNAPRAYLTNGAEITTGLIMKRHGDAPVIFANPMETEEAAKSGLTVRSFEDIGWAALVNEYEGDRVKAEVVFWARCLEHIGVTEGKIGIYGVGHLNQIIELVRLLHAAYPQYEFAGELGMTLFDEAYITKDDDELLRLRSVAARTSAVLEMTWDFIAAHRAEGKAVINASGEPLTIGAVKRFVRRALLDHDLEDSHMIFAQGRDGGFPHSRGENGEALRTGEAIVFDLFPHELGGGYFHDCTRTWSIDYATPEVQKAYEQVLEAFDIAAEMFRPNMPAKALQEAVQDYFEANGHPTSRSHPGTATGYVHSLGHGVGMNIHERPSLSHLSKDTLPPGSVMSIEPGLYYPEQGFGVRIEDLMVVSQSGELIALTDFHKRLVLPLKG